MIEIIIILVIISTWFSFEGPYLMPYRFGLGITIFNWMVEIDLLRYWVRISLKQYEELSE